MHADLHLLQQGRRHSRGLQPDGGLLPCYQVTMLLCLVSADQHGELRPGPRHLRQVGHHRGGGRGADQRIQADIDIIDRYLHIDTQIDTDCVLQGWRGQGGGSPGDQGGTPGPH